MKRWAYAGVGLMLGVLALSAPARAQEEEGWRSGPREHAMGPHLMALLENDRVKAALGLTEQQVDRLRQITVEAEKSAVKTRADLAVRRIELRELLRADKPDREAIMKKVQEISDLRGQVMKQHVESILAVKTVLTPEQQQKLRAFRARGGRAGGWGPRPSSRPNRPGGPPGPAEAPAPPPDEPQM
jgi:Spy/CpxP family protein refolding chaperone